ncbi:MAG TPA: hypothetical protein VML55_06775 [Planctomycetaceae bacterium]|nr:hypothetical protein [Planctomycetaceae bacterium]
MSCSLRALRGEFGFLAVCGFRREPPVVGQLALAMCLGRVLFGDCAGFALGGEGLFGALAFGFGTFPLDLGGAQCLLGSLPLGQCLPPRLFGLLPRFLSHGPLFLGHAAGLQFDGADLVGRLGEQSA